MDAFIKDLIAYMPQIMTGLRNTVMLMVMMCITGLIGGIFVFYLTLSRNHAVRTCTERYVSFFIGTPLLVHLFLMYYGLPELGIRLSAFTVAVIGFTLNVSAYNARYLRVAYNGIDPGELEAARAQGFSHLEVFRLITLPQALRLAVPALTNQAILNLKDSSVVFLIQYTEFFAQVQELAASNFQYFKAYLLAGLVYLLLVSLIVLLARHLERTVPRPLH